MRAHMMMAAAASVAVLSCEGAPPTAVTRDAHPGPNELASRVDRTPIAGAIQFAGGGAPERVLITPAGICHFWSVPVVTQFEGDVAGVVTFTQQQHLPCTGGHITVSGPMAGDVSWNGRAGSITGQFTSNCTADASQPLGVSCDGVLIGRGSGGLAGVQFHFKWGPGWYPFPYEGTAFAK